MNVNNNNKYKEKEKKFKWVRKERATRIKNPKSYLTALVTTQLLKICFISFVVSGLSEFC